MQKFSEHYHDAWAQRKMEAGWTFAERFNEVQKTNDRLRPFASLDNYQKEAYREPIRCALKALIATGWNIEPSPDSMRGADTGGGANINPRNYNPSPADMTNLTLSKEMMNLAERLSEDAHDTQALQRTRRLVEAGDPAAPIDLTLVPYDLLTDTEKRKNRERCQELLKYIQYQAINLHKANLDGEGGRAAAKNPENRFANNLLEKLIMYLDCSAPNLKLVKPSSNFSVRSSYRKSERAVKFFFKVVLPLIEKYFSHHRSYFTAQATVGTAAGVATITEKESVANLFCKLANLLRMRMTAFGSDISQAVKCLQVLVKAIDARSLAKSRPEFVRTSMLLFFNNCADDLERTIFNLNEGKLALLRGTHLKTCTSLRYMFDIQV